MADLKDLVYSISFDSEFDGIKDAVKSEKDLDDGLKKATRSSKNMGDSFKNAGVKAKETSNNTKDIGNSASSSEDKVKRLAKAIAGGFVVKKTADFVKKSLDVFGDFEQGMANVKATMALAGEQGEKDYRKLWNAAKEMGRTTRFTAKDSADALNFIAQYGYKTEDAIKALPNVLNLASAGGLELAESSRIAMQGMASLGLSVDELGKFNDQLAKTAQTSGTNVRQMGEAVTTVGGIAKDSGLNLEEMNAQLGILADSAYTGAKGGTALRNVLLNMTSNDQVVELLGELQDNFGFIGMVDKNTGKFNDFDKVMKSLGKTLKKFTPAQQQAIKATIGGKENVQGLNILLEGNNKTLTNGKTKFEEYRDAIKNSDGAAKAMAETQNKTVKGAFDELKSAMEDTMITMFDTEGASEGLQEIIRDIAKNMPKIGKALQKITNKTKEFIDFVIKNKEPIIALLTTITTMLLVIKSIKAIESIKNSLAGIGKLIGGLPTGKVGLIILGIGALAGAFVYAYRNSEEFREGVNNLLEKLKGVASWVTDTMIPAIENEIEWLSNTIKNFPETVNQSIEGVKEWLSGGLEYIKSIFVEGWNNAWEGIKEKTVGIIGEIKGVFTGMVNSIIDGLNSVIRGANGIHFKVPDWVPGLGGKGFDGLNIPEIPRLAKGTDNWEGGIVQVHEKGGEIIDLPNKSRVYPHDESVIMAREQGRREGSQPTINMPSITINVNETTNAKATAMEVQRQLDNYFNEKFATLNLQMGYTTV